MLLDTYSERNSSSSAAALPASNPVSASEVAIDANLDSSALAQRRGFLRRAACGGALGLGGSAALPRIVTASEPHRRLRLVNAHTWEKLDIVYWTHGTYIDESLAQLNHLLRDYRLNRSIDMDRKLFDDLYHLSQELHPESRIHVLSGYRTPETNAKLRRRSEGVAKNSMHIYGRAVDLSIPGLDIARVHSAAMDLQAGGVGYYKRSGFIHMDTGRVRHWGNQA